MNYNVQNIALIDLNSYMQKNKWIVKMNKYSFMILGVGLSITSNFIFLPNAYAYIDPGSGSAIIYAIISVLVATGMTFKVYWNRIKDKLTSRSNDS